MGMKIGGHKLGLRKWILASKPNHHTPVQLLFSPWWGLVVASCGDASSQRLFNRAAQVGSLGRAAQIGGQGGVLPCRKHFFDGGQQGIVRVFVA